MPDLSGLLTALHAAYLVGRLWRLATGEHGAIVLVALAALNFVLFIFRRRFLRRRYY